MVNEMAEDNFQFIAKSSEVEEGKGRPYTIGDFRIALVRFEGELYAVEDRCPHADASIAFGPVEEGCLICPWHYAAFDLKTGEAKCGPAVEGVPTYELKEVEGDVYVNLPEIDLE